MYTAFDPSRGLEIGFVWAEALQPAAKLDFEWHFVAQALFPVRVSPRSIKFHKGEIWRLFQI
jgi:hypothetical protein